MYNRKSDVLAKRIFGSESNMGVSKKRRVTLGQVSESDNAERALKGDQKDLCTALLWGEERETMHRKKRKKWRFLFLLPKAASQGTPWRIEYKDASTQLEMSQIPPDITYRISEASSRGHKIGPWNVSTQVETLLFLLMFISSSNGWPPL